MRAAREQPADTAATDHAPEPWATLGRYARDAAGRIVVRGKLAPDIRRIVACVNALAGVPTEIVERWSIQVYGGAGCAADADLAEIPAGAIEAIRELADAPAALSEGDRRARRRAEAASRRERTE